MSQSKSRTSLSYDAGDQPVPGYTLIRRLGEGAMGVVWLAQNETGFEHALKVLDLTQRGARKEWRGLRTIKKRKLGHGNLLPLYNYWLKDADGELVPDTDHPSDADSIVPPSDPRRLKASSMARTVSRDMETTAGDRDAEPSGAATLTGGGTMIPGERPARKMDETAVGPTSKAAPGFDGRMPVQLIVAMEKGHRTLEERKRQCKEEGLSGVPVEELIAYMEQAAKGLDYLHRESIWHRDVKPANIMLVGEVAKVCDYGLVVSSDYDLTMTTNAYTPFYASPEAVANLSLTGKSDQYSLAITYVELRTGQLPYTSETAATVFATKETGKYNLTYIRKPAVRGVLAKALSKEPKDRYATCSEFIKELEKAEHSHAGLRMGMQVAAVAAFLLLGLAAAWAYFGRRPDNTAVVPKVTDTDTNTNGKAAPANGDKAKPEPPPKKLPPPVADRQRLIAAAREARLQDNQLEADYKLKELSQLLENATDPAVEQDRAILGLERLHLNLTSHYDIPSAVTDDQWRDFDQQAERLQGKFADQLQLRGQHAALSLLVTARLSPADVSLDQQIVDRCIALDWGRLGDVFVSKRGQEKLQQIRDALVKKVWTEDESFTSPVRRGATERLLASLSVGGPPLARLLSAESKLAADHADGRYEAQILADGRAAIDEATKALSGGNQTDVLDYGRFLRSRIEMESARAGRALDANEKAILLQWPESPAATSGADASWRTPRRTAQVVELLVRLGNATLSLAKEDIPHFQDLRRDRGEQLASASEHFAKAHRLGHSGPAFLGWYAVVLAAAPPESADRDFWAKVSDWAIMALADQVVADLSKQNRAPLVEYVHALATARRAESAAHDRNRQALAAFARLLQDEQTFREASIEDRDDRGVLENIVLPALALPALDQPTDNDRRNLAAVWAAKGRLIERNVSFADLPGVGAAEHADSYARGMLTANTAFDKARQSSEELPYVAGYGRTLLKLPREEFVAKWEPNYQTLSALIDRYDPQGKSDNPSLLFVGAWVSYRRAFKVNERPEQMERLGDSLTRYEKLAQATAQADPYGIRSLALSMASDAHVRAAFWTPIRSADEVRTPPPGSKLKYLQDAVKWAEEAEMDAGRRKPEEAFVSKGNGLEDMAYYCKLIDRYPKAVDSFQTAAGLYGPLRSNAYALLCQGRCEFRWAMDSFEIEGDAETQKTKLAAARTSLQSAVERATSEEPRVKAEATWWLGHALQAISRYERDVSARRVMLNQARQQMAAGAEIVKSIERLEWLIYLLDAMQVGVVLAADLRDGATLPGVSREALLSEVAGQAEDLLNLAGTEPGLVGGDRTKSVLSLLAKVRDLQSGKAAALEVLKRWEPSFSQAGDPWKSALVEVLLWQGDYLEGSQAEDIIRRADSLAAQIVQPELKERALGLCRRNKGDLLYRARLEKLIKERQGHTADDAILDEVIAHFVEAEKHLARAIDPKTAANLAALKSQKLTDVESGTFERKLGLSQLEIQRLRAFILDLDRSTHKLRTNAILVLQARLSKFKDALAPNQRAVPFPPAAAAVARPLHDFLKPFGFLGRSALDPNSRAYLEVLERKLGI